MFHANAWGLAPRRRDGRRALALPGPQMHAEGDRRADRGREGHARGRRADDLDGRAAASSRAATCPRCATILCGGSAVPKALSEAYREQLGLPILQAWGMTETSPLGSVGRIKRTLLGPLRGGAGRPARRRRASSIAAGGAAGSSSPAPTTSCRGTARRAASCRSRGPWIAAGYYNDERSRRLVHRGRLAAHRRRRDDHARRLRPARRPHQGPRQVRRRVDLLGRARERDHGPPEGRRGRRDRRSPTRSGASGRWPASCPRTASELTLDELGSSSPSASPSGGSPSDVEFIDEVPKTSVGKFSKKTLREQFSLIRCVGSRRGVEQPGSSSGS